MLRVKCRGESFCCALRNDGVVGAPSSKALLLVNVASRGGAGLREGNQNLANSAKACALENHLQRIHPM